MTAQSLSRSVGHFPIRGVGNGTEMSGGVPRQRGKAAQRTHGRIGCTSRFKTPIRLTSAIRPSFHPSPSPCGFQPMKRRQFLEACGLSAAACWYPALVSAAEPRSGQIAPGRSVKADVLIVGGGLGGCAAALAATEAGRSVLLTEPTDWIGGQLTQQAVPPDEHRWIERCGASIVSRPAGPHPRPLCPLLPAQRPGQGAGVSESRLGVCFEALP